MKKEEIEKIISELEKDISNIEERIESTDNIVRLKDVCRTYYGDDRVVSFAELAEDIKSLPEEEKILTGWTGLDKIIGGFRLEQLVVVSALTKSGKTTFLMELSNRLSEYAPLWFPFEESANELVRKYLERGLTPPKCFTPLYIKANTLDWIETKICEGIAKFNSRIVVIDQLDFLVAHGGDNRADRIGDTMRKLKGLAKKWNVVIFLICHLQKTAMDTQPTLEDLRGSSSIGQEADTVIILWRQAKREFGKMVITNKTNVSVQANRRNGTTGNVEMIYSDGRFLESDWSREDREHESKQTEEMANF